MGQILRLTSFAQDDHVGVMTFYMGDCSWEGSATVIRKLLFFYYSVLVLCYNRFR